MRSTVAVLMIPASFYLASTARAQTPAIADATYDGFLKGYLIGSGSTTPLSSQLPTACRKPDYQWHQAYLVAGIEDAYNRNKAADRQALIGNLVDSYIVREFTIMHSTDLAWDSWNDDDAWATLALTRGYQITDNPVYLQLAENVWNNSYARGW